MRLSSAALALALMLAPMAWANDISNTTWSETDASNNSTPPNGWPSGTMTPVQVEPAARAMMGAIKRFYNRLNATETSGGSLNAQTLTYAVAPEAYRAGDAYVFIAGFTNTGSATLNVNSLGATTIKVGTLSLTGGELIEGRISVVYYDGTDFQLLNGWGGVVASLACAGLTDDGTACTEDTGTSGHTLPFLDGDNTWSGTQTFGDVIGTVTAQTGTSYTLAASDCGTTIRFTSDSAITLTLPDTLSAGCSIAIVQAGSGQISTSVSGGATRSGSHGFTKTYGQWAVIGLTVDTNSGGNAAHYILTGDGAV